VLAKKTVTDEDIEDQQGEELPAAVASASVTDMVQPDLNCSTPKLFRSKFGVSL
jgi:hypothetical protein